MIYYCLNCCEELIEIDIKTWVCTSCGNIHYTKVGELCEF